MIESDIKQFIWEEKYRPHKVRDCILPQNIKDVFQKFVDQQQVPNMLLVGPPGTGKTTVALAMIEELQADKLLILASIDRNIDTLRNDVIRYASSGSMFGGHKYVILDEADYLNKESVQPALRNAIDKFKSNCGFILTANFPQKLIEPIHSRCVVIDFTIPKNERPVLAKQFLNRVLEILKAEKVTYEKEAVASIIMKYFPDWRRTLNELQRYAAKGPIDSRAIDDIKDHNIKTLIDLLKGKKFTDVRQWVHDNVTDDGAHIFRQLYNLAGEYFTPNYIPQLVLIIADYQYKASFVADHEINISAFCAEVMMGAEWK